MSNEKLAIMIQNNIDTADNMLKIWQQNTGLICQMAGLYSYMAEKEDLQQEGYIALCDAVDHYDPERGGSFSTVLFQYLQSHLVRYCQNNGTVRIPVHAVESVRKYQKLVTAFRQQVGRKPTDREICYYLQISEKELQSIQYAERMSQISSTDIPVDEDGETTLGELAADQTDVEGNILDKVQQEQLESVIWPLVDALPSNQGPILRMRYDDGLTLKQAGERLGVSLERVRQQEKAGLKELRKTKNARQLLPFLPEEQEAAAYHGNSVQNFNRTWTSGTERVALQLTNI